MLISTTCSSSALAAVGWFDHPIRLNITEHNYTMLNVLKHKHGRPCPCLEKFYMLRPLGSCKENDPLEILL